MTSKVDVNGRKSSGVNSASVDNNKQSWLNLKEAPPTADELEKFGFLTQSSFLKNQTASQNATSQPYVEVERSALTTPRSQPPSDVMLAVAMAKKLNDSTIFKVGDTLAGQPDIAERARVMNISSDSSDDELVQRHRGTRIRTPMGGRSRKHHGKTASHVNNVKETSKISSASSEPSSKSVDVSERFKALSVPVKQDIKEKQKNIYSLSAGVYPYGRYVDVLSSQPLDR